MKRSKKKFFCGILAFALIATATAGIVTAENIAAAETTTVAANTFEMKFGATARIKGKNGIRFASIIGQDVYDEVVTEDTENKKGFGMVIVPDSYLDDYMTYVASDSTYEGKYYEYFKEVKKQLIEFSYSESADATEGTIVSKNGGYEIRGALGNIHFNNFNRKFIGIAYIKTENTDGAYTYEYADFDRADNARSAAYVCSAAINDGNTGDKDPESLLKNGLEKAAYNAMGVTYDSKTNTYSYAGATYATLAEIPVAAEEAFAFGEETASVRMGNSASVQASAFSSVSVDYSVSDENVATVDEKGNVTGISVGTTTVTAKVGYYTSQMTLNVLSAYDEYGASEMINVKTGKDSEYVVVSDIKYGKSGVYAFTGSGWNSEINAKETTHVGTNAIYKDTTAVRKNLNEKGYKYVAIDFALSESSAISVLGIIPYTGTNTNETGGLNFVVGSALAYRPAVDTDDEKSYFTVYAKGAKVEIGTTVEAGVWYTVVVKLQLDTTISKEGAASFVTVGFGATGNSKPVYVSGVRYYTNDTWKADYVYDYITFGGDEFIDTKTLEVYTTAEGEIYGKTNVYNFTGNSWNNEINAINTTHIEPNAIYADPTAVRANLNNKGYKYIAMEFCLSEGASIRVLGSSIYGTLGVTFSDGSAIAYAGNVAAENQAPYFHFYANGKEVKIGDTAQSGVWYTVVIELLLDASEASGGENAYSSCGFGVGNNKPVYIAGGRYYTNDTFKTDYVTTEVTE